MKKLISFFIITILLFTAAACASNSASAAQTTRGELTVAYDNDLTKDLLVYFQANQSVLANGVLLDAETDYEALASSASVALLKDEAIAEKLKALGWTETEDWTEAQKKANDEMFRFTVLVSPSATESGKKAAKLLTDWLVGDGSYEATISTMSGSCSCKRTETKVTITSDAPELCKDARFAALVNP